MAAISLASLGLFGALHEVALGVAAHLGLGGVFVELAFLSLHDAANAGSDAPAVRLNADKASVNSLIAFLPRHWVGKG
jgi:hypothetical protein